MKQDLTTLNGDPISNFCFGTMQFGGNADNVASESMFEACVAAGINFFDSAYVYTDGRSEQLLGELVAGKSDRYFIATKCASTGGASRENILSQFDESRKRLQLDCVDLLYLHKWNTDDPLHESFETLAGLIEQGKIRHIGVSNFAAWQVMKAATMAQTFGVEIAMLQPMYNLVKRQVEVEILPIRDFRHRPADELIYVCITLFVHPVGEAGNHLLNDFKSIGHGRGTHLHIT